MPRRLSIALIIAIALALPALLPERWQSGELAAFVTIGNLPGSLCGLLFDGRFFPPEGYIGQSLGRWMLMVIVQAFLWFMILSCFHFLVGRFKRADPDATRSI